MPNAIKRSAPGDAASSGAPPAAKKARPDRDVQKYYAVRAGRKPGVYLLWPDCQSQISGFKGAQCTERPPRLLILGSPFPSPPPLLA